MAFVWLLPAALHSGVLPSVLVLSTVALCFRILGSCMGAFSRARGLGLLLWGGEGAGGEELATESTAAVRLRRSCMTFVWLLPAALHSGAPVSLSLVDRGVVFQMPGQLHGAHVLDQPLRRLEPNGSCLK